LLRDWDGRLTVLLRNRANRHIERCPVCSQRRHQEMEPAMFLAALPVAALPLAAAALPAGLRDQVLRAATGNSPLAVARRAAAARTPYRFGHHGFPKPLHPPKAQWWHLRPVHAGAAAGTAAAVTLAVTMVATAPHHAAPPAGGRTAGADPATSSADAAVTPGARSTARPVVPAGGSHPPASPTAPVTRPSASASASAPATTAPATPPATGTLSVNPTTLDVTPPAVGTITLSASGGGVDWTIREPPGLTKKVVVSPMSGTLAAGTTATVRVTVKGPGKPHVHLVVNPGGTTVTVVVG
jgi:hypothetical protein